MSKRYERVWLDKPVMRLDNATMVHVLQVQEGFQIERQGENLVVTHERAPGVVQEIPWTRVIDARVLKEEPKNALKKIA